MLLRYRVFFFFCNHFHFGTRMFIYNLRFCVYSQSNVGLSAQGNLSPIKAKASSFTCSYPRLLKSTLAKDAAASLSSFSSSSFFSGSLRLAKSPNLLVQSNTGRQLSPVQATAQVSSLSTRQITEHYFCFWLYFIMAKIWLLDCESFGWQKIWLWNPTFHSGIYLFLEMGKDCSFWQHWNSMRTTEEHIDWFFSPHLYVVAAAAVLPWIFNWIQHDVAEFFWQKEAVKEYERFF